MKTPKIICTVAALAFSITASQAVETDPVGFVTVTVPANSDAILAVPLNRTSEFKGTISSISGNTVTVSGTPGWTTNQFAYNGPNDAGTDQLKTYAMQIASVTKEGLTCSITLSGTNTLTVTIPTGEDLTGINAGASGDQIDVLPYWTPASLINSAIPQDSQILQFKGSITGVNVPSDNVFYYDSGAWYDDGFAEANTNPLDFGSAFIFRNGGSAATTISMVGVVPMTKHRLRIKVPSSTVDQDIAIGFSSPVPTAIGSVGLNFTEDDQLLVFNNSAAGQNKPASAVYYYVNGDGWVDDSFAPVGTSMMLQPGQGYIFRKKAAGNSTYLWTSLQSYLQP
jgi:hypothetical protein